MNFSHIRGPLKEKTLRHVFNHIFLLLFLNAGMEGYSLLTHDNLMNEIL